MVQVFSKKAAGIALGSLWAAIVAQTVWIGARLLLLRGHASGVLYAFFVTAGFAVLALTRGRTRWIAALLRIFVGVAFLSAVCDRLGLLGGPGTPGVSWGNFANFVAYTGQVNSFLPARVIPALAVAESFLEGILGAAMLLGAGLRAVTWASAALLFSFGIAMTISLGVGAPFPYAVWPIAAGTWALATTDASWFSLDAGLLRLRRRQTLA